MITKQLPQYELLDSGLGKKIRNYRWHKSLKARSASYLEASS